MLYQAPENHFKYRLCPLDGGHICVDNLDTENWEQTLPLSSSGHKLADGYE